MGREKGAKNLAKFNEQRSEHLIPLLTVELETIRKRKFSFKTIGLLASYVSERTGVHRTTLLRNPKYKGMLAQYLATQPGAVSQLSDSTLDPHVLQAKLAAARLEASNLREKTKELEARLSSLKIEQSTGFANSSAMDFSNLAAAMANLLAHARDFEFNFEEKTIRDPALKPSENLVAGPERLSAFIKWCEQHKALPVVLKLKKAHGG